MTVKPDYAQSLPEPTRVRALLQRVIEWYSARDALINRYRLAIDGKNPIAAPTSLQYKVVVKHSFRLQSIRNEKRSRYRALPEFKVIPMEKRRDVRLRQKADDLELALNVAVENMETTSGDPVWSHVCDDVIMLDAGVERIERAPAAFWPEISVLDKKGQNALMRRQVPKEDGSVVRLFEDGDLYEKHKDDYLKQAGIPLKTTWVPLERFYPVFEGGTMVECFEVEERSLREVKSNPLFKTDFLSGYSTGSDGGLSQKVVVLHYSNQIVHAYYALGPTSQLRNAWPDIRKTSEFALGEPILLHSYNHGLGRPIYNYVTGRGGGWKGGGSRAEGTMFALLELSQDLDELNSQVATYARNVMWPTRLVKYSRESRAGDEALPTPMKIPEGGTVAIWSDESIENMTQVFQDFQLAEWLQKTTIDQMNALAGSPALFGERQPGINTGYHQQLQLTQAEHLDSQIESALAQGAKNRALIMLGHVQQMGEKCYVTAHSKDSKGRISGKYICIDPDDLDPMPQLAVKVRDPKPTDLLLASQVFTQMTQIRPGHGTPAVDDAYALENFMGVEDPGEIDRRKREQDMRNKLWAGPLLVQKMGEKLGLAMAQGQAQTVTPEQAAGASPGFQGAIQQINQSGEPQAQGGISPENATAQAEMPESGAGGALAGVGGGLAPGQPQPAQTAGRGRQLLRGT